MRRHSRDSAERDQRHQRFQVWLADARTSVALTAARVLRHRDDGLRTGVHTPTLAAFVAADLGYVVLRRAALARIDRRIGFRP